MTKERNTTNGYYYILLFYSLVKLIMILAINTSLKFLYINYYLIRIMEIVSSYTRVIGKKNTC